MPSSIVATRCSFSDINDGVGNLLGFADMRKERILSRVGLKETKEMSSSGARARGGCRRRGLLRRAHRLQLEESGNLFFDIG